MHTLEAIAIFLNLPKTKIEINNIDSNYLEGYLVIEEASEVEDSNKLYVISPSVENKSVQKLLQEYGNFVLFSDNPNIRKMINPNTNIIILPKNTDINLVSKKLNQYWEGAYRVAKFAPHFSTELVFGNRISKHLSYIERKVKNPLAIVNSNLQVTAMSSDNYPERVKRSLFEYRGSEKLAVLNWKESEFPELDNHLQFPKLIGEPFSVPRIFSKIELNDERYYLVCVEYESKFEEEDLVFWYYISEILEQVLSIRENLWSTDKTIEHFFDRIINHKETDKKYIKKQAYVYRFPVEGTTWNMLLLTNPNFFDQNNSKRTLNHIRAKSGGVVFGYKHDIVIITDACKVETFINDFSQEHKAEYYFCVSLPYSDTEYLKDAYMQCCYMRDQINEYTNGNVMQYEEYMISHFYMHTIKSTSDLDAFVLSTAKEMVAYDLHNETNYTQIVYLYISNFRNIDKTAKDLNVHRNTIVYRLGKATDIFQIDLDNYNMLHNLKNSIDILNATKKDKC